MDFNNAKEIVHKLNLRSRREWQKYCNGGLKPSNIPSDVSNVYKNSGWINWCDWLGKTV